MSWRARGGGGYDSLEGELRGVTWHVAVFPSNAHVLTARADTSVRWLMEVLAGTSRWFSSPSPDIWARFWEV